LICSGLKSWRISLHSGYIIDGTIWPEEPLLSKLIDAVVELDLPRLTHRHPELIDTALRAILQLTLDFHEKSKANVINDDKEVVNDNDWWVDEYLAEINDDSPTNPEEDVKNEIASSLVNKFVSEWESPLQGLVLLDGIYGSAHGLLSPSGTDDNSGGTGGAGGGFGLSDGIWKHQGWKMMKSLQDVLQSMDELKDLISSLGRRPSSKGKYYDKYPPQCYDAEAAMNVIMSPAVPLEVYSYHDIVTIYNIYHIYSYYRLKVLKNQIVLKDY
jgi:hypothetical protein